MTDEMRAENPIVRGSLLAMGAAVLFGVTTPLVKHFGESVGAFATAALLYAGAAAGSALRRASPGEPRSTSRHALRIVVVAVSGAVLAPAAFAWGLQRSGALSSSLLLNLEAAFTLLLARLFYREPVGRRVLLACALMMAGGAVLALRLDAHGGWSVWGLAAVCAGTLGWALDNTLTRPLADLDPRSVVFWKAATGAVLSAAAALVVGDAWPTRAALLVLLVCGATGYGLSLTLYLGAQRNLGAARTGSLFALAPFVGAALSFAFGDRSGMALVVTAAALFGLAVYLHVTEVHHHRHVHEAIEHDHAHRHDDGHHTHEHDPPVSGSHGHPHRHERLEHDHPHASDVHHRHGHD
jgi:drug/metabolite transporter (DMT)-like permease